MFSNMGLEALSPGQVTFFVAYAWSLSLWIFSEYLNRSKKLLTSGDYDPVEASDTEAGKAKAETALHNEQASNCSTNTDHSKQNPSKTGHLTLEDAWNSGLVRCMLFDLDAIQRERATLKAMSEFGTLMAWYFVCDRTPLLGEAGKSYNRDTFFFIFVVLTSVAFGSSLQTIKAPALLNRPQTEEWKGWMQVLFLLYHYFEAREIYNAIRIFIAGYVWMTGYGNFHYYYKTNDYCIGRFSQMMWRLNFLVFFACLVLRNSYMLYYICPMHTIFTVLVYGCLAIAPQYNQSNAVIFIKMLLCVAFVVLCWDIKPVFYALWKPFTWLVGYVDPRKPSDDVLYEWYFRSSLDRYVWIYGMLCAWIHPHVSSAFNFMDNLPPARKFIVRGAVLSVTTVISYFWYTLVYCLPKLEYNQLHPYTSWIPISLFIIYRNFFPTFRLHHLRLYGWLGCITLETYIGQFHIWLKTTLPDGQPKAVLSLVPGYPLINFALCSAGYVFVSHRLFNLTNTLKSAAVPHSNNSLLLRNVILMTVIGLGLYFTCFGVMAMFVYP
ncbi:hypothetical protein CEUSTIGMA_g8059.t1 [Chlamydomonas eustigma]|uniref:Cas1p 10 TM acyl transferase domain-containing protein n=1 Tax=Chlamydomonas eustigma TaxID=1157962 RepID=A0A250XC19_9CHLO|nr:hypothetical protein CEUSTIGMA_g8059.t1 [Chlamydomonas eustigma]|eukprot:GAX80624.1 hypothetical protein CEUSTIGMA_g8059.t1 [Chlamydomonas eustigma]